MKSKIQRLEEQQKSDDSSNQEMENRMKRMKEERDSDIKKLTGNRPPSSF